MGKAMVNRKLTNQIYMFWGGITVTPVEVTPSPPPTLPYLSLLRLNHEPYSFARAEPVLCPEL